MRTKNKNQKKSSPKAQPEVALTTLAPGEARRLVKPHTGFEQWVEPLAGIFAKYPDELGTGGVDVTLMRSSLSAYQALAEPQSEAAAQLALLDDSRLVHSSQAWDQMLVIYRRAKASAKKSSEVARALAEFERWMKNGPRKKTVATVA